MMGASSDIIVLCYPISESTIAANDCVWSGVAKASVPNTDKQPAYSPVGHHDNVSIVAAWP